jgi:hypothetical protein
VFTGHKGTEALPSHTPKPALALLVLEGKKQPRISLLSKNSVLGIPAVTTWTLKGDDLSSPKSAVTKKALEEFGAACRELTHSGVKVTVWWGLR